MVGESGSGKSVTFMTVMGLINRESAQVERRGALPRRPTSCRLPEGQLRRMRGDSVGMVFQDPMTSLHPMFRVGDQIAEGVVAHRDVSGAGGRRDGRGRPAQGRHPRARAARPPVPARVLGRHAPARDDRHGAGARPRPADRRRAHHGPRRDRAGADPRADRRDEGAPRDRRRADQPQPGRHRRRRAEDDDHVRRPAGRDGHARRDLPRAPPPLRLGAARVDPAAGRARRAAGADRGHAAVADPPAARLRVPPALPAPLRALRPRGRPPLTTRTAPATATRACCRWTRSAASGPSACAASRTPRRDHLGAPGAAGAGPGARRAAARRGRGPHQALPDHAGDHLPEADRRRAGRGGRDAVASRAARRSAWWASRGAASRPPRA